MSEELQSMVQIIELYGRGLGALGRAIRFSAKGAAKGVNIIAYRSQYGSANPAAVIAPAIVATFFSTVVAVVYCKMMGRR